MSFSRAAHQLRPCFRAAARPSVARPQLYRQVARRTYASGGHGSAKAGGDAIWAAGAIAVTVPSCWYILSSTPDAAHGHESGHAKGHEKHEKHEEEPEEEAKEDSKDNGEESEDKADSDDADKSEDSESSGEDKETNTPDTSDDEEKVNENSDKQSEDGKDNEDAPKDKAAASKPAGDKPTQSGKQEGLSNADTKHSVDISKDPSTNKKGEGALETAKVKGSLDPKRSQPEKIIHTVASMTYSMEVDVRGTPRDSFTPTLVGRTTQATTPAHRASLKRPAHITLPPIDPSIRPDPRSQYHAFVRHLTALNLPGPRSESQETDKSYPNWMARFCIEPTRCQDSDNGCLAVTVPCATYGKIDWRLRRFHRNESGFDSGWKISDGCNWVCCGCFAVSVLSCGLLYCLPVCTMRTGIRGMYGIKGNFGADIALSILCPGCTLAQCDREVRAREGQTNLINSKGYQKYKDQLACRPQYEMEEPRPTTPLRYISPRRISEVPIDAPSDADSTMVHLSEELDTNNNSTVNGQIKETNLESSIPIGASKELAKKVQNPCLRDRGTDKEPYKKNKPMIYLPTGAAYQTRDGLRRNKSLKRRYDENSASQNQVPTSSKPPAHKKRDLGCRDTNLKASKFPRTVSKASGRNADPRHVTIEEVPDSYFSATPRTPSRSFLQGDERDILANKNPSLSGQHELIDCAIVDTTIQNTHLLTECVLVRDPDAQISEDFEHGLSACDTVSQAHSISQHALGNRKKVNRESIVNHVLQHYLIDCDTVSMTPQSYVNDLPQHHLQDCSPGTANLNTEVHTSLSQHTLSECKPADPKLIQNFQQLVKYQHALIDCGTEVGNDAREANAGHAQKVFDSCQQTACEGRSEDDDSQHTLRAIKTICVRPSQSRYLRTRRSLTPSSKQELSYVHDFTECQIDQIMLEYILSGENVSKQHDLYDCSGEGSGTRKVLLDPSGNDGFRFPSDKTPEIGRRPSDVTLKSSMVQGPKQHRLSSCPVPGTGHNDSSTCDDSRRESYSFELLDALKGLMRKDGEKGISKRNIPAKNLIQDSGSTKTLKVYIDGSSSETLNDQNGYQHHGNHGNQVTQEQERGRQRVKDAYLLTGVTNDTRPCESSAQCALERLLASQSNRRDAAVEPLRLKQRKHGYNTVRQARSDKGLSTTREGEADGDLQLKKGQKS
ncbi:hypothetical protein G7Y89_g2237 [Cudoniella acicularis]|uniref:Uncharacterized protein n=1 Tax=Cudoniella acicularis TaxID=354080 RepID=A0A8H4RUU6_9HELO|nr:hypothetical protein G7Y89_g2237 [Cudoniella acicularis]